MREVFTTALPGGGRASPLRALDLSMPRISAFHGIVITMYYREHGVPHFHARYAEHDASVAIDTLEVLEGFLPGPTLGLVREWAGMHRDELTANWERARGKGPLKEIDPLP
jgi:hypothetical protein